MISVVEQMLKCTLPPVTVAVEHGSSVFFGIYEGVMEWDTKTGAVTKIVEHTGIYRSRVFAFGAKETSTLLGWVFGVDVTADGRVLVSADKDGLVVATDLTTKTVLFSKQINATLDTLRIHDSFAFVPVFDLLEGQTVHVMNVMTGDVLRRYPVLRGQTSGLVVIPGVLPSLT